MIVDLILRNALVQFSLLRVSYYYNLTEQVCYVYSVYELKSYSDLSIYVYFMLSQYTPAEVNFMILYFDLQQIPRFIMFSYWSSQNSTYITNFEPIRLWYFVTQIFAAVKYINNLVKAPISKTKQTLKYRALSGVRWLLWWISWI